MGPGSGRTIPVETAWVARAAHPKGTPAMWVGTAPGSLRFVSNAVTPYTQWLVAQLLRIDFLNKAGWRAYQGPWIECGSQRLVRSIGGQMDSQGLALYLQTSSRHLPAAGTRVDVWWRGRPRGGWSSALAGWHRAATQTLAEPATRGQAMAPGQTVDRPHWTTSASPVGRSSWSPIRTASDAPLTLVVLESLRGRPLEDTCSASVKTSTYVMIQSGCDVHVGWAFR
jgi:hypothetical protein